MTGTKYLLLFDLEKYNAIYDRIRYLTWLKSSITYVFPHNYVKIKIDSDNDSPLEETLTLHVIILIKPILNKNPNHYYYHTFLEKCLNQIAKK